MQKLVDGLAKLVDVVEVFVVVFAAGEFELVAAEREQGGGLDVVVSGDVGGEPARFTALAPEGDDGCVMGRDGRKFQGFLVKVARDEFVFAVQGELGEQEHDEGSGGREGDVDGQQGGAALGGGLEIGEVGDSIPQGVVEDGQGETCAEDAEGLEGVGTVTYPADGHAEGGAGNAVDQGGEKRAEDDGEEEGGGSFLGGVCEVEQVFDGGKAQAGGGAVDQAVGFVVDVAGKEQRQEDECFGEFFGERREHDGRQHSVELCGGEKGDRSA